MSSPIKYLRIGSIGIITKEKVSVTFAINLINRNVSRKKTRALARVPKAIIERLNMTANNGKEMEGKSVL